MTEYLENQAEAASSARDVKPQRLLLFEQLAKKAEQSIPDVDDFLIKATSMLDLKSGHIIAVQLDKFFEVWVCLIISPRLTKENSLVFDDGTCFTKQQLELIYGIDFVDALIQFSLSLRTFSQVELKLFITVAVLSYTSTDNFYTCPIDIFDNNRAVEKLKDFCASFFDVNISQKVLRLRELVERHNSVMEWFSNNYWPRLNIMPLISSRLTIPSTICMHKEVAGLKGLSSGEPEAVETKKRISWDQWSRTVSSYMELQRQFRHPCLESLTKEDQVCLLKHGFIETWFCRISSHLTGNVIALRPVGYERKDFELMYGLDFVDAFMETLLSLQAYQLSALEMKLFHEIVLLSQRPGLDDVAAVQKLQDCAIENFRAERLKNQKNTNDVDIPQILSKLQELSSLHSNSLNWLIENSDKLRLPTVFCELMDIPNFIFNV